MAEVNTIGIVGGGQLARMLAYAARELGFKTIVTDPTPNSPAGQLADSQIVGGYKDEDATRELAEKADVITVDAEFVNVDVLQDLVDSGKKVYPSPRSISLIKDKLRQKEFLSENEIPTAEFVSIETEEDARQAGEAFGYPLLLKAREDAYDGKGNFVVQSESEIETGFEHLRGRALYVEEYVPFVTELAVMVARGENGDGALYPVVETTHVNNICDTVVVPADISDTARVNAEEIAEKVMEQMDTVGVFGIEMFLGNDDTILVNEIAPRVHNSGHYSIEACVTSQFEQHIRAITGLPLGNTKLMVKAAAMKNILGTREGNGAPEGIADALKIEGVSVHMYGKHEARVGRKMGHITAVGNSVEECLEKVTRARDIIKL